MSDIDNSAGEARRYGISIEAYKLAAELALNDVWMRAAMERAAYSRDPASEYAVVLAQLCREHKSLMDTVIEHRTLNAAPIIYRLPEEPPPHE